MLIFPSPFPFLSVTGRALSDQPGSFSLVPKNELMHCDVTKVSKSYQANTCSLSEKNVMELGVSQPWLYVTDQNPEFP